MPPLNVWLEIYGQKKADIICFKTHTHIYILYKYVCIYLYICMYLCDGHGIER